MLATKGATATDIVLLFFKRKSRSPLHSSLFYFPRSLDRAPSRRSTIESFHHFRTSGESFWRLDTPGICRSRRVRRQQQTAQFADGLFFGFWRRRRVAIIIPVNANPVGFGASVGKH